MLLSPDEWFDEINNGLDYRRQFAREDAWQKLELDYINDPASDCTVGPNLIYSMGDALLSSLCVPDPEFVLSAEHPSGVSRTPVVEAVDNWLIKKLNLKREVEDAVMNSYLFSRAILKIGYDSEFGWSPYYDIGKGNDLLGMTLTQFDKKGKRIECGSANPGMPWVQSVSPHDIVVPWGTKNLDNAPWIAHRVIRSNDYIKKDAKYINKSRLEPSVSMEDFIESYGHVMSKDRRTSLKSSRQREHNKKSVFNVLWEIHDKMTGKVLVVSPDYDKFLRDTNDALQIGGLPFVSETLINHPRSFWSTPQAYYLGQIQKTQYDISLQAEKQRRINTLKFIAAKRAMSEDELNKLISGDVGAVGLAEGNQPLRDIFVPFPQGNNINFTLESDANRANARDMIGFSRNQLGEYDSSSRRTAREATFVKQGAELRTSKRMNSVINLYVNTIRKVNKIIFRYWKLPRYAMVGNDWVKFTGEELDGEYLYDVTLSTKRNVGLAQRKLEAMQMVMQLAQVPGVNIEAMKKYVSDASGDPAFPALLGLNNQQQQSNQQQQRAQNTGREKKEEGGS